MPKMDSDGVYRRKDRDGYWISWTDAQDRRRYRKTEAETLEQARFARSAETLRVEQARYLGFTPPGEDSFADVAARFLAHQKARLTPKGYEREKLAVVKHLKAFFTGKVAAIRKVDVQRFVTMRSAQVSASTVQKELNALKHMLRLAVEWEIVPINRALGAKAPRPPAGRVRYLQPTELRALLETCPEWLRPVAGLAVSTGMRRGEILGLRWLDVDIRSRHILLPQTKNGEGRIVHLNEWALAAIRFLPFGAQTKATDRPFANLSPEQVSVAFKRACRQVGIEDFRFHDLRHTAASWLRMSGADIHTVAQLLGHKDLRMAARYQHLSPAFLAEAVGRLDGVFGDPCYPGVTSLKALPEGQAATA
jgi:integrase